MLSTALDDLVQYRGSMVPPVVPEEILIDILLYIFPVAPRVDAPEPVFEIADLYV